MSLIAVVDCVVYQVSNTCDGGAISSQLSINTESGAYDALENSLLSLGVDQEFIDEHIEDISELLAVELDVQKRFDDYVEELGEWKPCPNAMDGNSEIFRKKTVRPVALTLADYISERFFRFSATFCGGSGSATGTQLRSG